MKNILTIFMLLLSMNFLGQALKLVETNKEFIKLENFKEISNLENNNSVQKVMVGNETAASAQLITSCLTSFTCSNYGASAEGCGVNAANVDCNNSTGVYGGGIDVSYTVERDIWYKFCPTNTGIWSLTITPSGCNTGSGYQYSILSGTPTNFSGIYVSSGGPNPLTGWTGVRIINLNVTSTVNCIYIQLDGYAGTQCNFSIQVSNPTCSLPIELIYFNGEKKTCKQNVLTWATATENNNDHFEIERSTDAINFKKIKEIPGAVNSFETRKYVYEDYNPDSGINYYRLKQVDLDGTYKYKTIIYIDNSCLNELKIINISNLLGQEVTEDYIGPKIIHYNDGSLIRKLQ